MAAGIVAKRNKKMENYQKYYSIKALNTFLEKTFEIAFGDDAINKNYTMIEVVNKLREFSDDALRYEDMKNDNKIFT